MQMNGDTCRTKMKPQMVVEETLYKTKRFFLKTIRNIHFFLFRGYRKLPGNPFSCPIFSGSHKIGPKLQETDDEAVNKDQRKGDDQCSKVSYQSGVMDLKEEEKKARKYSVGKEEEPSFLATEKFAQKMEELEMMDVNNGDHVMDIDEVIHQYSLLTSPIYIDIVDKLFADVYCSTRKQGSMRKLNSGNTSMRKLDSTSVHGSMRKADSYSVHGSMRKMGSASVHGSMRKVGTTSVHGSMRKVGTASVHGSMRKVGSASVHGSMRKSGSTSVHGSMRKLCIDSSMRNLGPLKL